MEVMKTAAILEDQFTPVLRKISAAQSSYAQQTMRINAAGNVSLAVSAGVIAFGVQSVITASKIDEIRKSLTVVEGANKAAFDLNTVDAYSRKSKQTYMDLAAAVNQMGIRKVPIQYLQNIADIAAATKAPLQEVVDLYARLEGGQVGFALGERGMARFGIRTQDVFAAEGLKGYKPGGKIDGLITPEQAMAGIAKVIAQNGYSGLDQRLATTTLSGSFSMVEDAASRFQIAFGKADLPNVISLLNGTAGAINHITDALSSHPEISQGVLGLAAGGLVAGGVLKGIAAYRQYTSILKIAQAAGKAEQLMEGAKPGLARAEGDAVGAAANKYISQSQALRDAMVAAESEQVAVKAVTTATVESTAAVSTSAKAYAIWTGSLAKVPGLLNNIKVGLLGLPALIKTVPSLIGGATVPAALGLGTVAAGAVAFGWGVEKILGQYDVIGNDLMKMQAMPDTSVFIDHIAKLRQELKVHPGDTNLLKQLAVDEAFLHKISGHDDLVKQRKAVADAAAAQKATDAHAAAIAAANNYKVAPQLTYEIGAAERKVQLLTVEHKSTQAIVAARGEQIKLLTQESALLQKNAAIATDAKAKYELLTKAGEDNLKVAQLKAEQTTSKIDEVITKAIGGGLTESFLRTVGVSPMSIASWNKNKGGGLIKSNDKDQIHVHVYIDGKQMKNDVVTAVKRSIMRTNEVSTAALAY